MSANAFQISSSDNVAVVLDDTEPGVVKVLGAGEGSIISAREPVRLGHKIALVAIAPGDPVMKYGVRIGHATAPISPGDWVHLHNCASDYDERSNALEVTTGAPTDTPYE
jgi:altronate dehydratase small subunit